MTQPSKARGTALGFGLLQRYVTGLALRPMLLSLGVVLAGLLLERVLRIVDVLAAAGAPVYLVFALSANLVPHYLGFAMPAAFALGVFAAFSRLSSGSELESMLSSGVSVWSLAKPLMAIGAVIAALNLLVSGYLDPYSRYSYRAILNSSVSYAWRAHAPAATFINVRDGLTVTADEVDNTGRNLTGVFIEDRAGDLETLTTARAGKLEVTPDGKQLQLRLSDGVVLRNADGQRPNTLRFRELVFDKKFALEAPPFRPRGGNEREMTMNELWSEMGEAAPSASYPKLSAEFHSRIVRSLAIVFLPLLIIPLSMTMRRQNRVANMGVAALALILFQNVLQIGETLAEKGLAPAPLLTWGPLAGLVLVSAFLFTTGTDRPGDSAISRFTDQLSALGAAAGRALAPLFRRRAAARG